MDVYIAQIIMFGGNFAIQGYAFCQGQTLAISQYQALFALIGTTYGGDGRTTMGLPDLRGRAPVSFGQRSGGGSNFQLGQLGGTESVTLSTPQMPTHTHDAQVSGGGGGLTVSTADGDADPSSNTYLAKQAGSGLQGQKIYTTDSSSTTPISGAGSGQISVTNSNTGGSQPVTTMSPYQAVNFLIALNGTFPPRD